MITGKKKLDEKIVAQEQRPVSGWRALVVTGLVASQGFGGTRAMAPDAKLQPQQE
jgi:hypothetical protein